MHDPFSDVLSALGTRSVRGTSLEASGAWALSFDGRERLKFVAVTRGRCWLMLHDHAPEALEEGDVILLAGTRYTVASDPCVEPVDGMPLYDGHGRDTVRLGTRNEEAETVMIGGGCGFAEGCAAFVLEALPQVMRIGPSTPRAGAIARTLAALYDEVRADTVGGSLVAERLADILVVEAVRAYVAAGPAQGVGWIAALAAPRIARAIQLMHGNVARRWTVAMLAQEIGMSRSALTLRFSQRVGRPPLDYLTRWRMMLAQRRLALGASVAEVAAEVGYASQSAFAQAFKRTLGRTPRGQVTQDRLA